MAIGITPLENRSILRLSGNDIYDFLQGLITNDIHKLKAAGAIYAALLTPQGKFMFDMIIVKSGDNLLLDIEKQRKDDLIRRLTMYKLRADVTITDEENQHVWALFDTDGGDTVDSITLNGLENVTIYNDPRTLRLGKRIIASTKSDIEITTPLSDLTFDDYEYARIQSTAPDGSRDMMTEKYFWLETNAEALNGVDFQKGCYVGQELTARMKHRTSIKKNLITLKSDGRPIPADTPVTTTDGKTAGTCHTASGDLAIAYIRLEYINENTSLRVGDIPVSPVDE
jgi:folate-binding protein YgfZ